MNIDNGPWIRHEGEEWSKEAHSPVDGAAWPKDGLGLQPQGWSSWDAGECLYSIDVDSQGKRIATAGSDAKVKVWSVLPLLSLAAEHDEAQHPRLLATISEHSAPVNTVRFSGSAQLLATCSDDRLVCVLKLLPGPGKTIFGTAPSLENWQLVHALRGHSNNVVDVEWSPDDALLATCSLDNTVIIWKASTGRQVIVLEGHDSHVKGLCWDPIGQYLASQSDDKSLIIWRCSDWTQLTRITSPFTQGFVSQTFSLRLCWTPDGQHIVAANSFQPPQHCACVLSRGIWKNPLSIVGHKDPVTVITFNPAFFKDPTGGAEPTFYFAMGSQDWRVTLWQTSGTRPRIIISKLFEQPVTDLAWTADGRVLLACSLDGQVCVARFEDSTLGERLTPAEKQAYLEKSYGGRLPGKAQVVLPETAAQIGLEQSAKGLPLQQIALQQKAHPTPKPAPQKPIEPLQLTAAASLDPGPQEKPTVPPQLTAAALPDPGPPKKPTEPLQLTSAALLDLFSQKKPANPPKLTVAALPDPGPLKKPTEPLQLTPAALLDLVSQKKPTEPLQRTKSGKAAEAVPSAPKPAAQPKKGPSLLKPAAKSMAARLGGPAAAGSLQAAAEATGTGAAKTDAATNVQASQEEPAARKRAAPSTREDLGRHKVARKLPPEPAAISPNPQPRALTSPSGTQSRGFLGVPNAPARLMVSLGIDKRLFGANQEMLLKVTNTPGGAQLACCEGEKVLWKDALMSPVLKAVGNQNFSAAATQDGSLYVYSKGGRRLLPTVRCSSPVAYLCCRQDWRLMAVLASGSLRLWDVEGQKLVIGTSLPPLRGAKVSGFRLTSNGLPAMVLTDGSAHVLHLSLKEWMCISSPTRVMMQHANGIHGIDSGELNALEEAAVAAQAGLLGAAQFDEQPLGASQRHLENQMASAIVLESTPEYKRWLLTYVRHLSGVPEDGALRELCNEFLGPVRAASTSVEWESRVLGLEKRALLKDVLKEVSKHRIHQRLVAEFKDLLSAAEQTNEVA